MNRIPPISDLIPHEAPMIWLEALEEWRPGFARCRAAISSNTPFVEDDALSTVLLLEYMAQAVAACLGYGALRSGEPVRVGMIIACRSFETQIPTIQVGTQLSIEASQDRELDFVSHYSCSVQAEQKYIAKAQMTLFHASEPPS